MATRIPPLLDPYLRLPPEASLILLTRVLAESTNWLLHRHLYARLGQDSYASVVLVSFLRDHAFWKDGAKRLGLDLETAATRGSFVFVDGLTSLYGTSSATPPLTTANVLTTSSLSHVRAALEHAIAQVQKSSPQLPTVLIVDQPDLLLAASADITSQALQDMLLDMREKVHSSIVTVSADEPLISSQATSLEKEHASLTLSLAHDAYLIMSLRMLDTGTAKDVSGVLQVTPGKDIDHEHMSTEERELLYLVGGDGTVRVFERGQ
ncbi:hypothetical protein F5Y15DRAFT_230353 [Xylariaceae sp. FL0016]|nr:hypothetical protein F5Y15DRAFT_230353 [Xylariaceae sp. FL0016]